MDKIFVFIFSSALVFLTWALTEASHQNEFRELESYHETERQNLKYYYRIWVVKRFNLHTKDEFFAFKQGWDARDEIRRMTQTHAKHK